MNSIRCVVSAMVAGALLTSSGHASQPLASLGPANPGAENGFEHWYYGELGGGSVSVEADDPATGYHYFRVGIKNATAYGTNHADLRSEAFSLKHQRGPFTVSFDYKLPEKVKLEDNLEVYFRFFGPGRNSFLDQEAILVGSSTADSEMTQYRTMVVSNILAPKGAVAADIWVVANIFRPWTSGYAQFDNFAVTAAPARSPALFYSGLGIFSLLVIALGTWLARRRNRLAERERT